MSFDFPSSPTLGQTFTPVLGTTYAWNGYAWALQTASGLVISDTPPASPFNGQMWFESDTGRLWISYFDGNSTQWVAVGGGGIAPINAPQNNLANGKLVESHTANAATFAIKTLSGADPSATNPAGVLFPDGSTLIINTPVSLTLPDQEMFGVPGFPLRLWFALANDGGTPRLVVRRCIGSGAIQGFDPRGILSAALPSGTVELKNYSNAVITNRTYRIIAFVDYETPVPSNSSWTTSPERINMVGPNTPLPGTVVQTQSMISTSATACMSGGWVGTSIQKYITPQSLLNGILVECYSDHHQNSQASYEQFYATMTRNGITIGAAELDWTWSAGTYWGGIMYAQKILDFPFLSTQINYQLWGHLYYSSANYYYLPYGGGSLTLQEIMG